MTDDQWLAIAEANANADWNSDSPDGFINAIKAVGTAAIAAASQGQEQSDLAKLAERYRYAEIGDALLQQALEAMEGIASQDRALYDAIAAIRKHLGKRG